MYIKLSDAKLKTDEDLEVGVVMAPDQEHSDSIAKVLHHKGDPWLSHVNRALSGDIKELETRFYIGKLDGQVVAIGEIGLDYYRDLSPRPLQRAVFEKLMSLAYELKLPIIIHNRDSHDDMLAILKKNLNGMSGVMHCFSGDQNFADQCLEMGLYVSFAGPVTYPNAHVLHKVVQNIPDDRFFIETDCPYLSPQFMRGKRNEPSYIKAIAKKIAELRHTTFPEISRISTENAKSFFKIL